MDRLDKAGSGNVRLLFGHFFIALWRSRESRVHRDSIRDDTYDLRMQWILLW